MLTVTPPIPFLPPLIRRSWSMFGVPHMYTPRLDYWNMPTWTYASDNTPYKKTLEEFLDWIRSATRATSDARQRLG
jgi:hypothetical protein